MQSENPPPKIWIRNRISYGCGLVAVIALGLASRHYSGLFPTQFGKYPGDVLWALMVFLGWGLFRSRNSVLCILLLTLGTAYGVEFFKIYHGPWIDSFRSTAFGKLMLGSSFSWNNLLAYTIGAVSGALGELIGRKWSSRA